MWKPDNLPGPKTVKIFSFTTSKCFAAPLQFTVLSIFRLVLITLLSSAFSSFNWTSSESDHSMLMSCVVVSQFAD